MHIIPRDSSSVSETRQIDLQQGEALRNDGCESGLSQSAYHLGSIILSSGQCTYSLLVMTQG